MAIVAGSDLVLLKIPSASVLKVPKNNAYKQQLRFDYKVNCNLIWEQFLCSSGIGFFCNTKGKAFLNIY